MQLIVCTFNAAAQAERVSEVLVGLEQRDHSVSLGNLAFVRRDANGQISLSERADRREQLGEMLGGMVGAVTDFVYAFVGLVGPQAGTYAADETQNAVQRLVRDSGFPDEALYTIGERLRAGQSAVVTLARPEAAPAVLAELERLGGTTVQHELPPSVVAELTRTL